MISTFMKLRILLLLTLAMTFSPMTRAEVPADKRVEIEKMLRLTGMEKMIDQMKSQMITSMRPAFPSLSDAFWVKLEEELDVKELIDQIIPVYDKYYTLEDLKAVNAFYATPAGQKILSTLPLVVQESSQIGQAWGAKIGERVAREAAEQGAEKK